MWLEQKQTARRPGTPGKRVFIVDSSASMVPHQDTIDAEFKELKREMPQARLIVYGEQAFEIGMHQYGLNWVQCRVGNGTRHRLGWRLIKNLEPEATFFLSDGESNVDERMEVLDIAEQMSGAIHVFHSARNGQKEDELFMRELARISGGNFFGEDHISPGRFREAVRGSLSPRYRQPKEQDMGKTQLPDHFLEDDEFTFERPEDVEVDMRRRYILHTGSIIEERRAAPEYIASANGPYSQNIGMQQPQVNIIEPRGVISKMRNWLTSAPAGLPLPAPADYRGQIVDASYAPVPSRHAALPAPSEMSMPSQAGVRAKFKV